MRHGFGNLFHLVRELLFFLRVFLAAFCTYISQSSYIQSDFTLLLSLSFFFLIVGITAPSTDNINTFISCGQIKWLDNRGGLLQVCIGWNQSPCVWIFVSGVCECADFTAGKACERCLEGYYGNALIGTPGDCQPCPCPDQSSCARIASTGQVVCTNCPRGQTGETITAHLSCYTSASASRLCNQLIRSARLMWDYLD